MSTGQIVGGIVGAVVGFFVGGPAGALQGAALGAGVGGYLDPPKGPTVSGPRLSDLSVQTSTYGGFIPRVYGTIAVHGNLLWLENNKLKERVRKEEQGGKGGGGSTTVKIYTYSATFALALCQGPIAGVRRIWCGDKLLYNAGSDDLETIIASNQNAKGWRLYLGTDDQLPDPRYEADVGVGNAPAFRGIAYLVFDDFQLADYSNTLQVAQFKVEVVTIADYPGMRYLLRVNTGVQYLTGIISPNAGKPFIYDISGPDIKVAANGVSYQHLGSGRGVGEGVSDRGLPDPGSTSIYYFSRNSSGEKLVFVNLNTIFTETSIGVVNEVSGVIYKYIAPQDLAVYAMKLTSLTCNLSGTIFFASFCEASKNATSGDIDKWLVFDADGNTINGGGAIAGVSARSKIGMGRLAQRSVFVYYASCLSADGRYLYSSAGAADAAFEVFDTHSGFSSVFKIVNAFALGGAFSSPSIGEKDGVIYVIAGIYMWAWTAYGGQGLDNAQLSTIVIAESSLSILIEPADIDASMLSDAVRGYRVSGGTIRAAIEPLQGAFPFDVIPSGYQIKCVPRGQASVATIPWTELGASDGDEPGEMLTQSREMDTQLPARTTIKYLDAAREYAESEQYAERINTPAINRVDREMPLVITADEAAGVAEVLQNLAWLERNDLQFTLPPIYGFLEPSDVVTVAMPEASYELRLTESNTAPDGRKECKAKPNRAALYSPNASGGEAPGPDGVIAAIGQSLFVAMDIPVVDETLQNSPGFVGAMTGYTPSWPGGLLARSVDDGQTWTSVQGYSGLATIGYARGVLPASSCVLIDSRALTVDLISGELHSVSRDQMLAGIQYAAYGIDGRWEIVRFQDAFLQADGSYLVSGFVRGERGTEWASGLHADADYFVLLDDPDNIFIGMAAETIGSELTYRAITSGKSVDDANDIDFTYRGVNLECLSPVYAKGDRDSSSNFSGTFTRRSRVSGTWWTTGVQAPVGEASESYEIDVMSGSTVKRTISATSTAFTYSAANQTTDFGSPQSSITFRIHQLSSIVGRGYYLEVTL